MTKYEQIMNIPIEAERLHALQEEFGRWFDSQTAAGLKDFKIDVKPDGDLYDVYSEILRIEEMIAAGEVDELPEQTTKCSLEAEAIICKCVFDALS